MAVSAENADSDGRRKEIEKAIRFRTTSGLLATLEFVEQSMGDARFDREKYGVPLDAAETAEIDRRLAIQRALGPAKAWSATVPESAGFYIDQIDGGRPHFLFTADVSRNRAIVASLLEGIDFEVRQVEHSLAELESLRTKIGDDVQELRTLGVDVDLVGVKPSINKVVIGVVGLTASQIALLLARYGTAVQPESIPPSELDACNSRTNCPPLKGGIHIESTANSADCTSGWLGKVSGTSTMRLLTAGHCIDLGGDLNVNWRHNGSNFGKSIVETWYDLSAGDAGLISVSVASGSRNKFYASVNTDIRGVTSRVPNSQIGEGDFLCRSGWKSGYDCGHVTIPFGDRDVEGNTIHHSTTVDFDSDVGDSGAPLFEDYAAYGIHTDSSNGCCSGIGWFTSVEWAQYVLLNNQQGADVNWVLCTSGSCGF